MKLARIVLTILLALFATSSAGGELRVIDGDTIVLRGETIRVLNIDTPEIRQARCSWEKRMGLTAKRRMRAILLSGTVTIERGDGRRLHDRHGRTLARVMVDGQDVGERLINEGLARKWSGKRRPWCTLTGP